MKQKKRYILLRSENVDLDKITNVRIISNQDGSIIISCKLSDLSQVISEIKKEHIVTISGTLKSLRRSV